MRLIDAEALISELEKDEKLFDKEAEEARNNPSAYMEGYSTAMWSRANGIRDAIIEIHDAPTINQSADRLQGWIPCSERMPEYRKTVLISTFWGVKTGLLDSTEAYGNFWEIIEDDATTALHNIYAWMPLPEPWKGEENEVSGSY